MTGARFIELEGVRVNNLRGIGLKIRHNSLTVICGVSGSGKSSLAFDTLYSEGQRRYVETFSPSARQFLDRIERPAVDRITGLPPAIAIRQQLRADGPRSTLGTRTEIIASLRILFARAGNLYCPDCNIRVDAVSAEAAAADVIERCPGMKLMVVASVGCSESASGELPATLIRRGFTRAIHDGHVVRLEEMSLESPAAELLVIVDRITTDAVICEPAIYALPPDSSSGLLHPMASASSGRLTEAIAAAMTLSNGSCMVLAETHTLGPVPVKLREGLHCTVMLIDDIDWLAMGFSSRRICAQCRRVFPEPTRELLSFTSPLGACSTCEGTGVLKSLRAAGQGRATGQRAATLTCPECGGHRLNCDATAVRFGGCTLPAAAAMEIQDLTRWIADSFSSVSPVIQNELRPVVEHAQRRLKFLDDCGLGYLTLDRSMKTLSGGESQRAILTTALGSGLINTLYVLDEPTSGLHSTDTDRIITAVRQLQRTGNTVVVVEHDRQFILAADEVIEIGPGAGDNGGTVVFQGSPAELLASNSITGSKLRTWPRDVSSKHAIIHSNGAQFRPDNPDAEALALRGSSRIGDQARVSDKAPTAPGAVHPNGSVRAAVEAAENASRTPGVPEHWLDLEDVRSHNIHGLNIRLPLGVFCAVTGASGSGKSSLIVDALYPALCRAMDIPCGLVTDSTIARIDGASQLDSVLLLDQSPVQRSRRSIPATWIGIFDDIRVLLAETHEARKRNYSRAMFSFNAVSGGRCPACEGRGVITVAMQFLADIETTCEECEGRRFRSDVIEVRYRDRSIDDILKMTTDAAFTFFNGHHRIQQRLNAVRQVGLGYLRLGQPLSTISAGEAQRLRIAALLAGIPLVDGESSPKNRKAAFLTRAGRTLFLLDEPTNGLHLQDIDRLVSCIDFLIQMGHSVIVIDHDLALTSLADWTVELGPGAGKLGGRLVTSAAPAVAVPSSQNR